MGKLLDEEIGYWQQNKLPPAQSIYVMGPQEWDHHVHSEAFMEMFRILGFTKDQMDYVYKKVMLKELQGLRKVAREFRQQAIRQGIVEGVNLVPPRPPLDGKH